MDLKCYIFQIKNSIMFGGAGDLTTCISELIRVTGITIIVHHTRKEK